MGAEIGQHPEFQVGSSFRRELTKLSIHLLFHFIGSRKASALLTNPFVDYSSPQPKSNASATESIRAAERIDRRWERKSLLTERAETAAHRRNRSDSISWICGRDYWIGSAAAELVTAELRGCCKRATFASRPVTTCQVIRSGRIPSS